MFQLCFRATEFLVSLEGNYEMQTNVQQNMLLTFCEFYVARASLIICLSTWKGSKILEIILS